MSQPDSTVRSILERAHERAQAANLPYRGAVTPAEAHTLQAHGAARIVDVRTRFEAEYVGRIPDTPLIEWRIMGAPAPNPDFLGELEKLGDKGGNYLFLCRSGVRSHAAAIAATQAGYTGAFNILEGFEGDLDEKHQRGTKAGWRHAGLPWIQS
ncbi:MAG: rhodanese-like domain-containing protein [Burkholderiaceae bacterium]